MQLAKVKTAGFNRKGRRGREGRKKSLKHGGTEKAEDRKN